MFVRILANFQLKYLLPFSAYVILVRTNIQIGPISESNQTHVSYTKTSLLSIMTYYRYEFKNTRSTELNRT